MSSERDHAIVLRLTEYSETSQIVTLFGATHGLVRLIAKGARRSTKTRFAAGLDLCELGDLGFVRPRGDAQLGTLTDWVQRDAFTGLRRALLRLNGALYAVELVAALTEEYDPHPTLFTALAETLRALAGPGPAAAQIPAFQQALLAAIGYAPCLDACVSCHRPVTTRAAAYFSAGAGGLLCRDCEPHHVEKRRLPPNLLGTAPATGRPRDWFDLLDYHLTHIAGHPFRTAPGVAQALSADTAGAL